MQINHYRKIEFLTSAAQLKQLPPDNGVEIAFAGRSNAGKSSTLNALTQFKGLARVSKTPGRTQLINLFQLDADRRLVDLPGYGYAKVAEAIKLRWQKTLESYLEHRRCLKGVVLIMDIRHPLKPTDKQMIEWAVHYQLPLHILLNKADKLNRGAAMNTLLQLQKELKPHKSLISSQIFSASKQTGLEELISTLDKWFCWEESA